MRKRILVAALVGLMILGQAVAAYGRPVHVVVDGFLAPMEHEAQLLDGRTMVDADEVYQLFGWRPWASEENGGVELDGRLLVPIRYVADRLGLELDWDSASNMATLRTGGPMLSVLGAMARDADAEEISFDAALEMINERDERLESIEVGRIAYERQMRQSDDLLRQVFPGRNINQLGRNRDHYSRFQIEVLILREQMLTQEEIMDINEQMLREGNELILRNAVASVRRTGLDIIMLEEQLRLEEANIELVELMHELGMENDARLRDARQSIDRSRNNLDGLRTQLVDNRNALNNLLGLPISQAIVITDVQWDTQMPEDLQGHIETMTVDAPTMRLRQIELDLALFNQRAHEQLLFVDDRDMYYTSNHGRRQDSTAVIERRNAINIAEAQLSNAQDGLERQIRASHGNILQLQEQVAAARTDLESAGADYHEAMLRYMTGMISRAELDAAKVASYCRKLIWCVWK